MYLKVDGPARGAGTRLCKTHEEALHWLDEVMVQKKFGDAGNTVLIENVLSGRETSLHAICSGVDFQLFPPSVDYKRLYDGNPEYNPNTGSMGGYGPADWVTPEVHARNGEQFVYQALVALHDRNTPFIGCLYPGLMEALQRYFGIEYNARFGSPEAEIYMRLLETDLYELFQTCIDENLSSVPLRWKSGYVVCVVLTSEGYPDTHIINREIHHLAEVSRIPGVVIFHGGTSVHNQRTLTTGGRVLSITAHGETLAVARDRAYHAAEIIYFQGKHFRRTIALDVAS